MTKKKIKKKSIKKAPKKHKKTVSRKKQTLLAPLIVTVPHCGEKVPREAFWLKSTPKKTLLTDIDRFVDRLYAPAIRRLGVPHVFAKVHRYAADLNRYPTDVDQSAVRGALAPVGKFPTGFHWVTTTQGVRLINEPISEETHQKIVRLYHDGFHDRIAETVHQVKKKFPEGPIFHLDCHSMPSHGTDVHKDDGRARPDVVVSDYHGQSSSPAFRDLVIESLRREGFEVAHNWPYYGGRITQRYGQPAEGHHTIQIEFNRKLYMNEKNRQKLPTFGEMSRRLGRALESIVKGVSELKKR